MAYVQGITEVKFTNKKGIALPNADWLAGVDYTPKENENKNKSKNEEEDEVFSTQSTL